MYLYRITWSWRYRSNRSYLKHLNRVINLYNSIYSDINTDAVGFTSAESYLELEVSQDETFFDPNTITFSFRTFHSRALLVYIYDTCNNFLQVTFYLKLTTLIILVIRTWSLAVYSYLARNHSTLVGTIPRMTHYLMLIKSVFKPYVRTMHQFPLYRIGTKYTT